MAKASPLSKRQTILAQIKNSCTVPLVAAHRHSLPYTHIGIVLALALALVISVGCSHKKTNRGHLFRGDWAFEYNRTPWIGCPPDSGCDDERGCSIDGCEECNKGGGLLDCLKKGSGTQEHATKNKGFRRHCGMNPECTAKRPCCRTLGCGMWIDPSDPNTFATLGSGVKACGLTPFCSPMKPCGLTPNCGRIINQPFMQSMMPMQTLGQGGLTAPQMTPQIPVPTPVPTKPSAQQNQPQQQPKKPPTVAGPTGLLISRGIVPGVSTVTTGGVVAAAGVATPAGMMTLSGIQLPNGQVDTNTVIRACVLHPNCTPARPCGMTPGCGTQVPVAMVSNNAMMLASAMQTQRMPGTIVQAYGAAAGGMGTGRLVNPVTGQPVNGLTMSGLPQMGYPPIGYAPTGYAPGYPRLMETGGDEVAEEATQEETDREPEARSEMPVPKFHPIPSKPAFKRSEGLPVPSRTTPRTSLRGTSEQSAARSKRIFSDEEWDTATLHDAVEQAYLEGMSDAMDEVEQEIKAQESELAKTQLQEKILNQAKKLQSHIESQNELDVHMLEMQEKQQAQLELAQRKMARQAQLLAAQEADADEADELPIRSEPAYNARRSRPSTEHALREPARIPSDYVQQEQVVAPVNYRVANPSAVPQRAAAPQARRAVPSQMLMQQNLMYQQAMQQQNAGQSQPLGGLDLLQSAKTAGTSVASAVSGALSVGTASLSGLFGTDQPSPPRNPARHSMQLGQTVYPCPPQPVVQQVGQREMPEEEFVDQNKPKRPPTMPKKAKSAIDSDDDAEIRQVQYER